MNLVKVDGAFTELNRVDRGKIVGARALVVESHAAVALEIAAVVCHPVLVNGELLIVDTNTMTVSVGVGEETRLEDRIGGGLHAGWQMRWVESNLLDLGKVVLGVLVEDELANFAERELLLGPDVGQVEDVDFLLLPQILGLLGGHDLGFEGPLREVTFLDGLI